MKSNRKIIIVSLGIIFMILSYYNYRFFEDLRNIDKKSKTREKVNLKTANSDILILTPENKTYSEPMSGYYPATYGFENEADGTSGTNIDFVDDALFSGSSYYQIINEHNGHKKVFDVVDSYSSGTTSGYHDLDNPSSSGTIEFWFSSSDFLDGGNIHFIDTVLGSSVRLITWQGEIRIDNGTEYVLDNAPINNQWYHLRFDFECSDGSYMGLSEDTFYVYLDGFQFGPYALQSLNFTQIDRLSFFTGHVSTLHLYMDAFGFSWYPNYNIGDNLNEGLLLSYENSTTLDWMGYSLDNQANRTILGNRTITFPNRGPHTIQMFGIDSFGTIYHSPIRHFKIMFNLTGSPIYIDGPAGWSAAALQPWCTGSGTWGDPFIIEYILFDGQNSDIGIEIRNSNVFFIIRYSTIYNGVFAGIFLMNTVNGQLINNNISNNGGLYGGIYLYSNCDNITISGNTLNYNDWSGIHIESDCNNNTISRNVINNSVQYGISISDNSDYNNVTNNFFYFNNDGAIRIASATSENNRIERNIMVSKDAKFINDGGIDTLLISNHYLTTIPSLFVEIENQSFSVSKFFVIFNVSSQCIGLKISILSVQMWWNGIVVSSDNITNLGNGLYNVSLTPIFVEPGEEPILLNMSISATHHRDKYFTAHLAVEPPEIVKFLQIEIIESFYSTEHFNLTFFIFDENKQGIDTAIIQMSWDGADMSNDIFNLTGGFYFASLEPITVAPGENPILLSMIISVNGYEDKSFETYIAVDPETLEEVNGRLVEEFSLNIIIIASISIAGGIGVIAISIILLRKRK